MDGRLDLGVDQRQHESTDGPAEQDCVSDAPVPGQRWVRYKRDVRVKHDRGRTGELRDGMAEGKRQEGYFGGVCGWCE